MIQSNNSNIGTIKHNNQDITQSMINNEMIFPYYKPYKFTVLFYNGVLTAQYGSKNSYYPPSTLGLSNFSLLIGGTSSLNEVYLDYNTFGLKYSTNIGENETVYSNDVTAKYPNTPILNLPYAMYNNGLVLTIRPISVWANKETPYNDKNALTYMAKTINTKITIGGLYTAFTKITDITKLPNPTRVGLNFTFNTIEYTTGGVANTATQGFEFTWYSENKDLIDSIKGIRFYAVAPYYNSTGNNVYCYYRNGSSNTDIAPIICGVGYRDTEKYTIYNKDYGYGYFLNATKANNLNLLGETNDTNLYENSVNVKYTKTTLDHVHTVLRDGTSKTETGSLI